MERIIRVTELALIRSLPEFINDKIKGGRLKNKCSELINAVDMDLRKTPYVTHAEMEKARGLMDRWAKETGWYEKQKHITTLVSFLLAMIEDSPFTFNDQIVKSLNEIFDYFERNKDVKTICMFAGGLANQKWRAISEQKLNPFT